MIWSHAFSICLSAENMLKYYQEKIGSSSRQKRKRGGTSHEKENDRSSTGMPCLHSRTKRLRRLGKCRECIPHCGNYQAYRRTLQKSHGGRGSLRQRAPECRDRHPVAHLGDRLRRAAEHGRDRAPQRRYRRRCPCTAAVQLGGCAGGNRRQADHRTGYRFHLG